MITNLFYYNHYRPYILNESGSKKEKISSSKTAIFEKAQKDSGSENDAEDFSYFLNKSYKDNVKDYINNVSKSFNALKGSTSYLSLKLSKNKNFDIPSNVENYANEVSAFTNKYNRFIDFLTTDSNAKNNFSGYIESIKNIINENVALFQEIGIDVDGDTNLTIDDSFSSDFITSDNVSLNKLISVYNNIYQETCDLMSKPLSNHMEFKDFSYYLNYIADTNDYKTFSLVESGVVFDISI